MISNLRRAVAIALVAFVTTSCGPTYRVNFFKDAVDHKWTEEQKLAAYYYSFRVYFSRETEDKKFAVLYSRLSVTQVRERLDSFLKDLNDILGYNDLEMAKYLDNLNLRNDLKHEEKVIEAARERVYTVELDDKFKKFMGERISFNEEGMTGGYNAKKIFLASDLRKEFPFSSDQIENAKTRGILKPIEHATIAIDRMFDRKEKNPSAPEDINEFIWKPRNLALSLTTYKILDVEKPDNNRGNYIEGFRVVGGKHESRPAVKVFLPVDAAFAVIVIDSHKEGEGPGFGLPDHVEKLDGPVDAISLLRDENLLHVLFDDGKKTQRVPPKPKTFKVEIARVGDPIDLWERAPNLEGWIVPFKYRNEMGLNYRVHIKFEKPKKHDGVEAHHSPVMRVEYISKEWYLDEYTPSPGRVVEYYRPTGKFAKEVLGAKVVSDQTGKKVVFVFPDGSEEIGFITPKSSKFNEEAPYAIAYTEGQKRWWIEKDSGSSVFNKRKQAGSDPNSNSSIRKHEEVPEE